MTTAYTSLLGLALPVTGELSGTWGDTVNNSITSLLDSAVAGTTNISTDADVTLTTTTGAANTAREAILLFSGARTALRTITAPAQSKVYTVINATTGGYSVKLVGAGPTTGVTIVAGESAVCAWNGSDFIKISNTAGAGVFSSITNTGLTSGRVVYSTTGGLETDSANLTFNGTTLTANTLNLTNALGTTSGGTGLTSFTANGVVYASSTSALATGSALTFDGTNLGIGLTPGVSVDAAGAIRSKISGGSPIYYFNDATYQLDIKQSGNALIFDLNGGSEQMRLTSTGLGIGTSSPAQKLQVKGIVAFEAISGSTNYWANYTYTDNTLRWNYNGVGNDEMTLDSSGNLGLGVTPKTWYSTFKAFQFGANGSSIYGRSENNTSTIASNAYVDAAGNFIYINTNTASRYEQLNGQHTFYTAASGTAGTGITFTQAMTLDASGNLGVGTTSPSYKLDVTGGVVRSQSASGVNNGYLLTTNSSNSGARNWAVLANSNSFGDFIIRQGNSLGSDPIAGTDKLGIDPNGNLLVGTTSSLSSAANRTDLSVNGTNTAIVSLGVGGVRQGYLYTPGSGVILAADGANAIAFWTNATERARIDSSGNLLVGTTSNPTSATFVISGGRAATFNSTQTNAGGIQSYCTSSNNDEPSVLAGNNSSAASGVATLYSSLGSGNGAQNNTNCFHLKAVTQGVGINYLYGNGTTSFTSDARLKKNITSTRDGYAEDLCKLRVVKYNWNTAPDGEAQELGLIAQEVEQVFPGLVQNADMEIQGFTPKVLKASVLPFMLLKAMQEQQAIIESLKARLDAANL